MPDGRLYLLDQRRLLLLALQKWQESIGQGKIAEVIGGELCLNNVQIDGFGLRKVKSSLNARVQDDAVEISVGLGDTKSCKSRFGEEIHLESNLVTKFGILSSSVISNGTALALSSPCSWTNASRFSFLLPTTMTELPSLMRRDASALPIPLVAPMTRTFLYWKGIAME